MIEQTAALPPRYLRTPEAARLVGLSPRTLEKHRTFGTGPLFKKIGGRVIYAVADLQGWVERGNQRSTTDAARGAVSPPRAATAEARSFGAGHGR